MDYTPELLSRVVNQAAATASDLIYDYAAKFEKRSTYLPLERLASQVEAAIVEECVRLLNAERKAQAK